MANLRLWSFIRRGNLGWEVDNWRSDHFERRGETRLQSKKAAREGLAEVGVEVVRGMIKNEDGKAKNWTGMLQGMYPILYCTHKSGSCQIGRAHV